MDAATTLIVLKSVLLQGIVVGLLYAIIALGYSMVYGVLQLINFAHSEVFATGVVVGFFVLKALSGIAMSGYLKLLITIIITMIATGLLNLLIERLAYRPLRVRNAPKLVPLITAIGVSLVLQDVLRLTLGLTQKRDDVSMPVPPDLMQGAALFGVWQPKQVILVVVAIIMLIGLTFLINRTKLGRAIRAVAQDRQTAELMGINSNNIIATTFFIGGALAGVAGVLWGMETTRVYAYVGILPGLKSFSAAVLGGIGSIPGAVLGGLLLGWLETLIGVWSLFGGIFTNITAEWKDIGAFIALIIILIFKPAGLLGKKATEKV